MDERLKKFFGALNSDEAIILRELLDELRGESARSKSLEELEKQFNKTKKRIDEIERKALKRRDGYIKNQYCHICKMMESDVKHMIQAGSVFKICSICIKDLYAKLEEIENINK